MDVFDVANDGAYMHPTSYEKIKGTPILSTPSTDLVIDTMEVLMRGIIKRIDKWVEWTRARKNRTGTATSTDGVSTGAAQSAHATTT